MKAERAVVNRLPYLKVDAVLQRIKFMYRQFLREPLVIFFALAILCVYLSWQNFELAHH
ncbi:hypothetical protein A8990_12626 [Paenibacillus taihuensis]|uniref:Uncharacterized protein n=1 Tax=Paenibacillus taihuensis TaxID=1156355 RepID=A0A3D9RHH0_9BACL|nr:hypothetical protein A8990_12626 [Paenibacillus taihuensis]